MFPTAFNFYGIDRIAEWKRFRNELEFSSDPLQAVVELWSYAPFVNPYLDPFRPESWPDPWKLILDLKLDNLAIALGMLYTLQLTERFKTSSFEIHTSMLLEKKESEYFLILDRQQILHAQTRSVKTFKQDSYKIWSSDRI